ncbi:uncharacterized protein ACWYII_024824 isoform 1-T1 [Salvelinus alpinus]
MVSLLPYPREEAPHLFHRNRLKNQSQAKLYSPETLMEELKEQLTSVRWTSVKLKKHFKDDQWKQDAPELSSLIARFGFLGKPLIQFSCTPLMHKGANNEEEEDDDDDEDPGVRGVHVRSTSGYAGIRTRATVIGLG